MDTTIYKIRSECHLWANPILCAKTHIYMGFLSACEQMYNIHRSILVMCRRITGERDFQSSKSHAIVGKSSTPPSSRARSISFRSKVRLMSSLLLTDDAVEEDAQDSLECRRRGFSPLILSSKACAAVPVVVRLPRLWKALHLRIIVESIEWRGCLISFVS